MKKARKKPSPRALAAKKGWEKRRQKAEARSRAAKRAWKTRRAVSTPKKPKAIKGTPKKAPKPARTPARTPARKRAPKPSPKPKARPVTERDRAILSVWPDLSDPQKREYWRSLSAAGKKHLPKAERDAIEARKRQERKERTKTGKIRKELRDELRETLSTSRAKKAIKAEPIGKPVPPVLVQTKEDAAAVAPAVVKKAGAEAPSRRRGTKTLYYATISAVAEHPPHTGYEAKKVGRTPKGKRELSIFHFSAKTATSLDELHENIAVAIAGMVDRMPGEAPMAIVGVEVRTVEKERK